MTLTLCQCLVAPVTTLWDMSYSGYFFRAGCFFGKQTTLTWKTGIFIKGNDTVRHFRRYEADIKGVCSFTVTKWRAEFKSEVSKSPITYRE